MTVRNFCWICGHRISRRSTRASAQCETGHEIPEELVCTRAQYRAAVQTRDDLNRARAALAKRKSDPAPAETPALIEAAFEDAVAARRAPRAIVGNRLPSGGSAVAKSGEFVATIAATHAARDGAQKVYFAAAQVVTIRPDDTGRGAWLTMTGGAAQHVLDAAEILRRRVDLALCELARLGRGC